MERYDCLCLLMCCAAPLLAQQLSKPHGIYTQRTTVKATSEQGAEMRYTLDGSEPTMQSPVYDLQGRHVQRPARRGIYIKNEKLIIH